MSSSSIARRVSLSGVLALAATLLVVCALVSAMLTHEARDRVNSWVGGKTQSMVDTIDAMDNTARMLVKHSFGVFRQEFGATFTLNEANGELSTGSEKLNGDFTQVDKFTEITGGVATVFAAKGDDFIRIATSLKNDKGDRVMGTLLDRKSPAYAMVSTGQSYTGRASLFGRSYMADYEPIKNEAGKVVGILFIGYDLDAFEKSLDKMAADTHFFQSGGIYVVNLPKDPAQARFAVHPTAKGKLVSDVAPGLEKRLAELSESSATSTDSKEKYVVLSDVPGALGGKATDLFAIAGHSARTGQWVVAEVSNSEAMASHWGTLYLLWGVLALTTIGLGFGLLWMMRSWVASPLERLSAAVQAIAQGDLSNSDNSRRTDEIGSLIRDTETMRLRLTEMIGTVRDSVDSIGTASAEIATGNQDLSGRTEQTAGSLQVAASSMEQLTATVKQTAESARTANQLVQGANSAAGKGGEVVGQVVATMDEINASSKKIGDIISVIDGIAFQTNILALNAAVEAARAGEQGRGFAVVAGEVRSLAQRSAEAAKEIKGLIGASVERVETGARLVQEAGTSMNEIVSSVQRVSDIISEITVAAAEQSDGIGQVSQSIVQLDQMTQQNAALVEESAAAAESLKDQAHRLADAVGVFRLEQGSGASSTQKAVQRPATVASAATPSVHKPAPRVHASLTPAKVSKPTVRAPKAAAATKPAAKSVAKSAANPTATPATKLAIKPAPASAPDGDWETF